MLMESNIQIILKYILPYNIIIQLNRHHIRDVLLIWNKDCTLNRMTIYPLVHIHAKL